LGFFGAIFVLLYLLSQFETPSGLVIIKEARVMHKPRSIRFLSFPFITAFCFLFLLAGNALPAGKVDELLNKMTLEEKIGQMNQVSLEVVSMGGAADVKDPHQIDPARLREALVKYHVGSILNVATSAHSVQHWREIITAIQDIATKETRLKIPVLYGIDAVHGANYTKDATLFPQSFAMAATWNVDLIKKCGEITAYEVRASGIPWNFNPMLDMARQPLWPRFWETLGEDPYLAAHMAAAYVKGLQGDDQNVARPAKVAACLKHYLGYGLPWTGKDRTPAWIPDKLLADVYIPPFKAAIDAGAKSVMANSGQVNGVPVHASYYYLTQLLRNELGFKGMVVSDWSDIINLYSRDHVAANNKEAVYMAVMAGVDMSMVAQDYSFYEDLIQLVHEGRVPMHRIDEAVRRILQLKVDLGLFENPYPDKSLTATASEENVNINKQAVGESVTLVKNNGNLLPLSKNSRVLVTGPNADRLSVMNSGWTITWPGNREDLFPKNKQTVKAALENKIGKPSVLYEPAVSYDRELNIPKAVDLAAQSDVIVACLGEEPYCETPGNINDLTLPEAQLHLVEALAKTGKPIVLVLLEGRPRIVNRIVDRCQSIIMAYLPGMEGGSVLADILFGDVNPGGKLSFSYPRYVNDFTLYDHTYSEQAYYNPQWPFGFGLSYTTFAYSELSIPLTRVKMGEPVPVQVTVTNTGKRAGSEVVQLYVGDLVASALPAVKRLKGFEKVRLQPGESRRVTFNLTPADLTFTNEKGKPVLEPGEFKVMIDKLSQVFTLI
jgi:beta-glucosidase